MDAGTHRYFDTSSAQFDGTLKVMAMRDNVLTAAVIRLSPPGKMPQTGMPRSHALILTCHKLRH